uniref:Uncharacterized protein n=1 Tax=Rhizophora mucronata TaxID=61149 RepID=A0A2P2P9J2_RHIMU
MITCATDVIMLNKEKRHGIIKKTMLLKWGKEKQDIKS